MTRNEMLTRADKESLSGRNPEVSGLASEIMAKAGASRQKEDSSLSRKSHGLGVAAVDDMIQGWEKHEVDDPSTDRWPAAKQAELNPNHAADKAFDEKIAKWVEIPINCICAVVALPLAGALVVAASPLLGAIAGGEWLYRKLGGAKLGGNSDCDEPWYGLPDDGASGSAPCSLQEDMADRLAEIKERESRLAQAQALVDRADRVLADSRSPKALPDKGGSDA